MSALTEALEAAQAKALAALEKAYVGGSIDTDQFTIRMNVIGCTDTVDQALLIEALDALRECGQTAPAYTERRTNEKPTDAQLGYIRQLATTHEVEPPETAGLTRAQAGEIIDSLKNGTYDASKWSVPF